MREGGREGGKEGKREGGREGGRKGGREGLKEGGREGRKGGRKESSRKRGHTSVFAECSGWVEMCAHNRSWEGEPTPALFTHSFLQEQFNVNIRTG